MEYIFLVIILILSVVIHEVAHGSVANYLGDPTAKYAGRLTLNPIKHLDPVGSFLVPFFLIITTGIGFGWAKPVPINPYNFRDQKYGSLKVALAGPGSNFLLAIIFGFLAHILPLGITVKSLIISKFLERDMEAISNLFQGNFIAPFFLFFSLIAFINIILAVFNLIPIPPLDGSHILFTFLPPSLGNLKALLNQFGVFILFFLLFVFPIFSHFLNFIINVTFSLIIGAYSSG